MSCSHSIDSLSSRQLEVKINKLVDELRLASRYGEAAFIEFAVFMSRGYAPRLREIYSDVVSILEK